MANPLETELMNFKEATSQFMQVYEVREGNRVGRPAYSGRDVLMSLLFMGYRSCSYRRIQGDLKEAQQSGLIDRVPSKSTLNRFMQKTSTTDLLQYLISESARFFITEEKTAIIDSSWLGYGMYTSSSHIKKDIQKKRTASLYSTHKIHVCLLKKSRVVSYAIPSKGTEHDSPFFPKLLGKTVENGFEIKEVLADKGYMSKNNYAYCASLGIKDAFIAFKANSRGSRGKSFAYRRQFYIFKKNRDEWDEHYRFRSLVENLFSVLKRKFRNYVISRNKVAMDNELLLKILVYNMTIIGRYS